MSTVGELRNAISGRLTPESLADAPLGPVAIDSRRIEPGEVFWALVGPNFDGGQFASEAFARGARGAVVSNNSPLHSGDAQGEKGTKSQIFFQFSPHPNPLPAGEGTATVPGGRWAIEVDDTQKALNEWAAYRRSCFGGTMVAVTGSAGKTTARQMIHCVLRRRLNGLASPRNYNNHLGVPLSMTAVEPAHDYAVLELGANHKGEIAELAELVQPDVGVITCIGDAHLGEFGSVRKIAEAKAELLASLPAGGRAVLGDDPWLRKMASRCKAKILWVGTSDDCTLKANDMQNHDGRLSFRAAGCQFTIPVYGRHNLTSALAAVAVGQLLGCETEAIARALYDFEPMPMRCQVQQIGETTVINDAYNSNPSAMLAALELLGDFNAEGKKIVVCGDMGELGNRSAALHREAGKRIVEIGQATALIACGEFAREVVAGARRAGMSRLRAIACPRVADAIPHLPKTVAPGDVVLVKGSRTMRMEQIVEAMGRYQQKKIA